MRPVILLAAVAGALAAPPSALASLPDAAARPNADRTPPRLLTVNVVGRALRLVYAETLRPRRLAPGLFAAHVNGEVVQVAGARAARRAVTVTLATAVYGDDEVLVSYRRSRAGIVDRAGNPAPAVRGRAGANRSEPGCTARLLGATGDQLNEGTTPYPANLPALGEAHALLLFADFPDAPASAPTSAYGHVPGVISEFFSRVSYGRFGIRVTTIHRWVRLPRPSSAYDGEPDPTRAVLADAAAAVDGEVDFRTLQILYVAEAPSARRAGTTAFLAGPGGGIPIDGTELRYGTSAVVRTAAGRAMVHETGHFLGLPDLYDYVSTTRYLGYWDAMASGTWDSAELVAWHRWKLGWLGGDQLRCVRGGSLEATISPLHDPGGLEAVVVPIDRSRAYVVEVLELRTREGAPCSRGVYLHLVDAAIPSGRGPVRVVPARPDPGGPPSACGVHVDAAFGVGPGQVSSYDGELLRLEVLASSSEGYRVRVTRK